MANTRVVRKTNCTIQMNYISNDCDIQTCPYRTERKNGKWIDGMLYYDFDESEWEKVKCSVCENFVTKQIFYHDNKYHYCPYCGADMRDNYE